MEKKVIPGGLFISFEGPECSGKSTQSAMLAHALRAQGYSVLETREPGGTAIGEELRRLVKHVVGEDAVCEESELFLFFASRAQLTRLVILPFLEKGGIVLCDRYADSTTAYQGYGRGLDLDLIRRLNALATAGKMPDLTFLLDLETEKMLDRGQLRLETLLVPDRIEDESRKFHETVRRGYLEIARQEPERIKVFNALQDRDELHEKLMMQVIHALG